MSEPIQITDPTSPPKGLRFCSTLWVCPYEVLVISTGSIRRGETRERRFAGTHYTLCWTAFGKRRNDF